MELPLEIKALLDSEMEYRRTRIEQQRQQAANPAVICSIERRDADTGRTTMTTPNGGSFPANQIGGQYPQGAIVPSAVINADGQSGFIDAKP